MLGIGEGTQGGLFIKTIWKFAWERKMPNCIQLTNLARDVSGRFLMGPPQSLCQSLCFGLIIEPTSIFLSSVPLVCQGTWSRKGRAEREGRVGRAAQDTKGLSPSPVTKVPSHTTALQRGMAGSFLLACLPDIFYSPPPPERPSAIWLDSESI